MSKYVLVRSQFCMVLFLATIINVHGQQTQPSLTNVAPMTPIDFPGPPPPPISSNQVIDQFLKAEQLVRDSMNQHTFKRDVTVMDIDRDTEISEALNATEVSPESSKRDPITCKTKKSAPPVSLYVWPPDTTVQVYFMRGLFTSEHRQALVVAMKDWNHGSQKIGAGVLFKDAGETDRRLSCKQCLTVARKNPRVKDNKFYASFYPVDYERNGWLNSAWIEFSPATTDPKALQGYMAHELGHSLGLDNCPSCGDGKSIMNSFPGVNRHNGLLVPSHCDLEVVRRIYERHRKLAAASSQTASIGR